MGSTTLANLAESIEETFEKRFYATNNSTRITLHDNDLFLLTTAVDPRYRLDFFPANPKQKVVRLMKSELKNHSCCKTGQSGLVPLVPPNKPKNDIFFLSVYSSFKSETRAKTQEIEHITLCFYSIVLNTLFCSGIVSSSGLLLRV